MHFMLSNVFLFIRNEEVSNDNQDVLTQHLRALRHFLKASKDALLCMDEVETVQRVNSGITFSSSEKRLRKKSATWK